MKQIENEHIDFVVKYYQEGKLDTKQAIEYFHHLTQAPGKRLLLNKRIMSMAATFAMLIALSLTLLYIRGNKAEEKIGRASCRERV